MRETDTVCRKPLSPRTGYAQRLLGLLFALLVLPAFALTKGTDIRIKVSGISGEARENIILRLETFAQMRTNSLPDTESLRLEAEKALEPWGYFHARVNVETSADTWRVQVTPGSVIRLSSVTCFLRGEGANNARLLNTLKTLPLKKGDAASSVAYENAKRVLLDAADKEGFLKAHFSQSILRIDVENNTAEAVIELDTGPQSYFGQVQFDPTYLSPELLRRYIPFKPGTPWSPDTLLAFNDNLAASGYFQSVSVRPLEADGNTVPIEVHLEPAAPMRYALGLGIGTDTGVRANAGLQVIPLNRAGHTFNANAQGSFRENILQGRYAIPGDNPLSTQYNLSGTLSNLNYDSGYSNAFTASAARLWRSPTLQHTVSLNMLFERYRYTGAPTLDKLTPYPQASLRLTNATNPLFTPSGYTLALNGLAANRAALSAVSFAQGSADLRLAYLIEPLRTRLYLHTLQAVNHTPNIDEVPFSLALLLGGADNLRALSYNALGPGKRLTYGGFEVQKETFKNWFVTGFVDVGDVWNPTPFSLYRDAGAGLLWISPVGPIRVGFAQPLNNQWQPMMDKKPRLVINMGPDL